MSAGGDNLNDPNLFQIHWHAVEAKFDDIADCLRRESEFATGRLKLRIARVYEMLESQPTRDEILANRDTLEMLLPLLVKHGGSVPVETSLRAGVKKIAGNHVYRRNWLPLFWYPALVVVLAFFVCVISSFTLAPQFEVAVLESAKLEIAQGGSSLPWETRFSLATASFLRAMWIPITVVVCLAVVALWWINRRGRVFNRSGLGWWDDQSVSVRGAVAVWASHLASLLQVGVPQVEAFEIASREAPKLALRNLSLALAERDRFSKQVQRRPYFPVRKYAMLDHALQMGPGSAKIASLREVAHYYQDRDRYVSTWWMAWLSTALLWLTGGLVFGIFMAIFLPLKGLITSLTGLTGVPVGLGN